MFYNAVLEDCIKNEKAGKDYYYSDFDKQILLEMTKEINAQLGTSIQYLAEIDAFDLKNSGNIMASYITKFSSESVKCFLIPQMVKDRVENCDRIVLQSYLNFKESNEYISLPGLPAPAHIYVRYDNAFRTLKSKRIKNDLVKLMSSPRDAFYLPFTLKLLSSWRVADIKDLLVLYSSDNNVTAKDVGLLEDKCDYFPSLSFIKRELRLSAIDCLKYYPSSDVYKILKQYSDNSDSDFGNVAKKALAYMSKTNQGKNQSG